MIISVASYKGGVGKTTTSVHLASYLCDLEPTILFDNDTTRNALAWSLRAGSKDKVGLPFQVASFRQAAMLGPKFRHHVVDNGQKPSVDELRDMAEGSDLLVVPTVPSALDTDGLQQTLRALVEIGCKNYRVLLTRVAPDMARQAAELRELLGEFGAPVFAAEIPRLKAFEKGAALGTTVDRSPDPNAARAWAAYQAVGEELGL